MTKREKRLQRIRDNPKNVTLEELRIVLEEHGIIYRKTVGSHFTFSYVVEGQTKLLVVPFKRPIKPVYVKKALQVIDAILAERDESDEALSDAEDDDEES